MFKLTTIAVLALAICVAADPILRKPLRRQVLARQQVQPTAVPSGYPAAGVTPEIPFDLPTETEKPDVVLSDVEPQQPDLAYGPPDLNAQQPDAEQPNEANGPPEAEAGVQQVDEVYGPPEAEAGVEVQQVDEVYGPPETEIVRSTETEIVPDIEEPVEEAVELAEDAEEGEVLIDEDGAVISISSTFEKPARLVYQRFPQRRQSPRPVPARLTSAKIVKPANIVYTARFSPNFQRTN